MLLKDIRDYQILFLSLFLILGIGTRDWTLRPELIAVAIATCLSTQLLLSLFNEKIGVYVKAQIVRVAASSDKCSCGGTMTAQVRIAE